MKHIKEICHRCASEVDKEDNVVSLGYYAYCDGCDEDLLEIEVDKIEVQKTYSFDEVKTMLINLLEEFEQNIETRGCRECHETGNSEHYINLNTKDIINKIMR